MTGAPASVQYIEYRSEATGEGMGHPRQLLGTKLGSWTAISISEVRTGNRKHYDIECSGCGSKQVVCSAIVAAGKNRKCAVCRQRADGEVSRNQRIFTDAERDEIDGTIRRTIFGIIGTRESVDSQNCDTDCDDLCNATWKELLRKDLNGKPIKEIYKLASGIAKNMARRVFQKRAHAYVKPIVMQDGEQFDVIDATPTPEPDYDFTHQEQQDTLRAAFEALTQEERTAVLNGQAPELFQRLKMMCTA